jgi:hypothetical protein
MQDMKKQKTTQKKDFFHEIAFHNKVSMIMNERKINKKEFGNCRFL